MATTPVGIDYFVNGGFLTKALLRALLGEDAASFAVTPITGTAAASITAAAVASGAAARSGQSAARTDTTVAASAIIAALGNATIGQTFQWTYNNNGAFPITLAGGSGVTLAQVVPANAWTKFAVAYTAANTLVFTLLEQGYFAHLGVTGAANGATPVAVVDANVTADSIVTFSVKTPGGTVGVPGTVSKTAGTGFSFASQALDTSTYNYKIEG